MVQPLIDSRMPVLLTFLGSGCNTSTCWTAPTPAFPTPRLTLAHISIEIDRPAIFSGQTRIGFFCVYGSATKPPRRRALTLWWVRAEIGRLGFHPKRYQPRIQSKGVDTAASAKTNARQRRHEIPNDYDRMPC